MCNMRRLLVCSCVVFCHTLVPIVVRFSKLMLGLMAEGQGLFNGRVYVSYLNWCRLCVRDGSA